MTQLNSICYVVADGAHARVLLRTGEGFGQAAEMVGADAHRQARALSSDRPGRAFDSAGAGRHAMEPRSDPKELAKRGFAQEVAETVNAAARQDEFGRLVLVAPPKIAFAIKQALTSEAASRLAAEQHADLANLPEGELLDRLAGIALRGV